MANPIKPTPTLYGEDAKNFLKKIEEPPRREAIDFMKEILETFKDFDPFVENQDILHSNQKNQEQLF